MTKNKYIVIRKIPTQGAGEAPVLGEVFEKEDWGFSPSTIKYLISHGHIDTYHEEE